METELKYTANRNTLERISGDGLLMDNIIAGTRKKRRMLASYYDTADRKLSANRVAFRVRLEGDRYVATLKYGGGSEDGLHKRGEINIDTGKVSLAPFKGIEGVEGIRDDELICIVKTDFIRESFEVEHGSSVIEVCLDDGYINEEIKISEVELELISGIEEDLIDLGDILKKKYVLEPEDRSKFARGLG